MRFREFQMQVSKSVLKADAGGSSIQHPTESPHEKHSHLTPGVWISGTVLCRRAAHRHAMGRDIVNVFAIGSRGGNILEAA